MLAGAMFLASIATASAGESAPARRTFDLPAEAAEKALKRFSRQSGHDVVFATGVVAGVRTRPVKGVMTPREALEAMLAQTRLTATQDAATGAFMINRAHDPNADRAAPTPSSGDRPAKTDAADNPPSTMTSSKRSPAFQRVFSALSALFVGADAVRAQSTGAASADAGLARPAVTHGTVTGVVSNAATGEFLRGAILTVDGAVVPATTDRSGEFVLVVTPGRHVIGAAFTGLKEMQRTVEVGPGAPRGRTSR